VSILVKLLFVLNISGTSEPSRKIPNEANSIPELDILDLIRHKELVTFSISEIILVHLKAAKIYRI
jgi:hypothetical protein